MASAGWGMTKQIFGLFVGNTIEETCENRLYEGSYFLSGTVFGFPLRHRFDASYTYNKTYPDFTHWCFGWIPELLIGLEPCYFALGVGPYIKSDETPINGGLFALGFNAAAGLQISRWSVEVYLRHFCNAYTAEPNKGSDFFGVGVGYAF